MCECVRVCVSVLFFVLFFVFLNTNFFNATQLLWKGHNNKRQDQKESFAIITTIKRSL